MRPGAGTDKARAWPSTAGRRGEAQTRGGHDAGVRADASCADTGRDGRWLWLRAGDALRRWIETGARGKQGRSSRRICRGGQRARGRVVGSGSSGEATTSAAEKVADGDDSKASRLGMVPRTDVDARRGPPGRAPARRRQRWSRRFMATCFDVPWLSLIREGRG